MKATALLLLALVLAGCKQKEPEQVRQSSNTDYAVALLFSHDGCKVYRFTDDLRYRYFVQCDGKAASTNWTESCGKNCTTHQGVSGG